jgi:histone acetyltransferase (RNA polymerase elongator complex component)
MDLKRLRHYIIPVFIPQEACPHQCIFCHQAKISGRQNIPSADEIDAIIQQHLSTIPSVNSLVEIAFFGGSFTGIDMCRQKSYLSIARRYVYRGVVHSLRVSTRPDYIDDRRLALLRDFSVGTVEIGAQSMDDDVLRKAGRGHTARDTIEAAGRIRAWDFSLGLQMMIGLPGDTPAASMMTAEKIIALGADNTRIYPTLVIRHTPLAELFRQGKYMPLSLEKAVSLSKEVYRLFEEAGVNVIRMGLHPSEGLISGEDLIAGPFHPSFRELVMTELWREELEKIESGNDAKTLTVFVSPGHLNFAIGYKAANRLMLLKKYDKVNFVTDFSLRGRSYHVDYR